MIERAILEDVFVFASIIVGMGCLTGVVTTWIKWRGRRSVASPELMSRLDEINARMSQLDNAVDTIAVEVERITEGQRFVSRVLAERTPTAALPDRAKTPGSTTPH
jgi:hypothetical protein